MIYKGFMRKKLKRISLSDLVVEIKIFREKHNMNQSEFGWLVCKDQSCVAKIRSGDGMGIRRYNQIVDFINRYSPSGAKPRRHRNHVFETGGEK